MYEEGKLEEVLPSLVVPASYVIEYMGYTNTSAVEKVDEATVKPVNTGKPKASNTVWTKKDKERLVYLIKQNEDLDEIAKKLGRSPQGVRNKAYEYNYCYRDNIWFNDK